MHFTNKLTNICNCCFLNIFSAIKLPGVLSVHVTEELIVDVKEEETGNTEKEATDEKLQVFSSSS